MRQTESYDVLRLIEHGQMCYISSENVQGKTLVRYLKYHPVMKKKELFSLLKEIAEQLGLIHRCRGNPCYQYVNPYSIILAEDGQIYFLDMKAESNRDQVIFMQRRDIREYFLPPEENYYQHASKELDIYGLGKTFQYILASAETEPHLSMWEEHQIQKMISKTMGTKGSYYQSISELQKHIPRYKEKEKKERTGSRGKRRWKVYITLFLAITAGGVVLLHQKKNNSDGVLNEEKQAAGELDKKADITESYAVVQKENKQDEEYLELALAYFLNVGDMDKSRTCLKELKNRELAGNLERLIEAYESQVCPEDEKEYKESLAYLEKAWKKRSEVSEEKKKQDIQCLVRGYGLLDDESSVERVLELVKEGMQTDYLNDSVKKELLQYQADAYEKKENNEEAAEIYTEILEMETQSGNREEVYKKTAQLYEAAGRRDMAIDTCIQGIGELKESQELKLMHIRFMCADPSVSREECSMKIKEYVSKDPELLEHEGFKKLQKEYEITVEGEEVWVGR